MRFRLKYILGDYQPDGTNDDDPYADPDQDALNEDQESRRTTAKTAVKK